MTGLDHTPASPDGAYVRPINPSTLAPLDRVRTTSPAQLDAAAGRAAAALAGSWPVDSRWRAGVLADWGAALATHAAELADALVAETGKPIVEARQEVRAAVDSLAYNSGFARMVAGSAGTLPDGTVAHLVREPVGVTTFITPWNWPVLLLLRDLAPALAAGVTALVKPAPQTTLVTDRVLSIGRAAGLPADVVQLLVGTAEVGRAAVTHPAVRAVAFTGSSAVGAEILRMASSGMKRCLLELGGKGAMVICADADLPGAVSAAADAAVVTAGQMCLACTRVIVDRRRYAEVVERLVERLRTFQVGDPAEERTRIGPLVSPAVGERLAARLAAAGEAAVVVGGERVHPDGLPGAFIRPAVVTGVAADSPIVQTELFGPVVTVEPFRDDAEAVRLANATRFGLAIGVWTRDLDRAWRLARSVQAGTVWVNGYHHSYPEVPSGGVKSSGLGRSRGVPGLEQFTELKHIHFRVPAAVTEPGHRMVTGPDPPGDRPRWPAEQHLRSWLADLDQHGELGRVRSRISPDQEVAAVLERTDGRRAVLFSEVAGARFALAGNLVLGRAGLARAIGCAPGEVAERYAAALAAARPCVAVPPGSAPVLGHRLDPDQPLSGLPVTVQHERDAGRYLTAALLVVRDPSTGRTNLSINRMLVVDGARLRALLLPGRLRAVLAESERRHHNLPVAIVVGVDPLLGLASQAPGHLGLDDLEVASALRATPLPVVHAPTTGLPVPADAEFVLEGRFLANVREPEGPFGEFPRTYGPVGPAPVIEVAAGWHRETPMFQTILPGGREHFLLGGVPREAILLRALRQAGFDVSGVRLPESGSCRLQAVVALRDPAPGMAVNAMLATLGIATTVKWAVVVDDDVDIFDDEQVGWATATRVQADRDVIVVPGAGGSGLDPSARDGVTAKLGVDATVPRGDRDRYARIRVGTRDRARLAGYLAELGYPEGGPA